MKFFIQTILFAAFVAGGATLAQASDYDHGHDYSSFGFGFNYSHGNGVPVTGAPIYGPGGNFYNVGQLCTGYNVPPPIMQPPCNGGCGCGPCGCGVVCGGGPIGPPPMPALPPMPPPGPFIPPH